MIHSRITLKESRRLLRSARILISESKMTVILQGAILMMKTCSAWCSHPQQDTHNDWSHDKVFFSSMPERTLDDPIAFMMAWYFLKLDNLHGWDLGRIIHSSSSTLRVSKYSRGCVFCAGDSVRVKRASKVS
jgi:hypothetical protein